MWRRRSTANNGPRADCPRAGLIRAAPPEDAALHGEDRLTEVTTADRSTGITNRQQRRSAPVFPDADSATPNTMVRPRLSTFAGALVLAHHVPPREKTW